MDAMAQESATSRRRVAPVVWSLGLGVLTTLGLGVLTLAILITHAVIYGTIAVVGPKPGVAEPAASRYLTAFVVGAVVNLAGGPGLVCLALRTRARSWPPILLGLSAALVAAVAGACALLLLLGLNPVALVLDR